MNNGSPSVLLEGEEGIGGSSITPPVGIGIQDIIDFVDMPPPASIFGRGSKYNSRGIANGVCFW